MFGFCQNVTRFSPTTGGQKQSLYQGKVTNEFIDFYQNIINVMEDKVDAFILETQVSIQHIRAIMPIIVRSKKNI